MDLKLSIEFIEAHKQLSINEVALILSKKPELDKEFILAQINGIQKAKNKLPEFHKTTGIIYPSKLSMEQCSSEKTATYKSQLLKGESLIDLTGGFGIDSYYFSKKFNSVTYIEQQPQLFQIAQTNFTILNAQNIDCECISSEEFLKTRTKKADIIFIDPSRRNENQRVYQLADCTPNIIELAPSIFNITDKILIKTAPLLDIKQTLKDLKYVTNVWVISVENDCKEVLYLMEKNQTETPKIHTINLTNINQQFSFDYNQEENAHVEYSSPKKYLYESNTSILKAGAFKSITGVFNLQKIAHNTHLYTSEKLVKNFPGRCFEIKDVMPYQLKEFKKLGLKKANVSVRNFKENVDQVKKKLNIKDGGDDYLFATTNGDKKPIIIVCRKVNY